MDIDAYEIHIRRLLADVDVLKTFKDRAEPMLLAYEAHATAVADELPAQGSGTTDGVENAPEATGSEGAAEEKPSTDQPEAETGHAGEAIAEPAAMEEAPAEQASEAVAEEAPKHAEEATGAQEEPAVETEEPNPVA